MRCLADVEALDGVLTKKADCRLVVVDPISSYLAGTDSWRGRILTKIRMYASFWHRSHRWRPSTGSQSFEMQAMGSGLVLTH